MEQMKMTYREIAEKFFEFEKSHRLLSIKIAHVYPWEIVRVIVFFKIIDYYIPGNTDLQIKPASVKVKNLLYRLFVNSIFFNPFLDFKKKDALVFESGRKYMDDNSFIDIYTEYLCRDLREKNVSFTRYETNYNVDDQFFKRNLRNKHIDFILILAKVKGVFNKVVFNPEEVALMDKASSEIQNVFNVKIDLQEIIQQEVSRFITERGFYQKLFRLKKPKEIYIINYSQLSGMIAAAKEEGILVNELQHGMISEISVVANYPHTLPGSLHYFPDRFYLWDNISMCFGNLPLEGNHIIPFKNKHIEKWKQRTEAFAKDEKTILIISQPYSSQEIQDFLQANVEGLKDYTLLYKIHPVEDKKNFLRFKTKLLAYPNIRFIENEESIYVLLKKAQYVVGIYSSSLFEATAFNCKVILLNLPGVEMSFPLLENKQNILLESTQKLSDFL